MPSIRFFAKWRYNDTDWTIKRDEILKFFDAIAHIHPGLELCSFKGKKSGLASFLEQPLLRDVDDKSWKKLLISKLSCSAVGFWNRKEQDAERLFTTIIFEENINTCSCGIGEIIIDDIPENLSNDRVLFDMIRVTSTVFNPEYALIQGWFPIEPKIPPEHLVETQAAMAHKLNRMNMDHQEEYKAVFGGGDRALWRLWLKAGVSWPTRDVRVFDSWQNQQPDEEIDLLNGRLFTWNRFAPWNLPSDDDWRR